MRSAAARKGVVNADSARAARADLRVQGLTPIAVDLISTSDAAGQHTRGRFGERLSANELAPFTRQLASLLEAEPAAGTGVFGAAGAGRSAHVRDLVASIRSEVMGGASCRMPCRNTRAILPIFTGRWSPPASKSASCRACCRAWPTIVERRNALVQKVKLAFTYPAIVTVVAFAIVIFLLTYVVPQIVSVFANTKQKLPLLTVMMLAVSDFVRNYGCSCCWPWSVGGFAWRSRVEESGHRALRWHSWLLTAPLYGKFERSLNTSRFASTLAITIGSGVPILRALQTSRDTLSNVAMREQVEEAPLRCAKGSAWRARCRPASTSRRC